MAISSSQSQDSSSQIPLVVSSQAYQQDDADDVHISYSLHRLETFLGLFGFCQYSFLSIVLSWVSFLILGIVIPFVIIELTNCSDCEKYQIKDYEIEILVSESLLAANALLCVSQNLRMYGVRKFLFVDRYHGHMSQFRDEYLHKINDFFRMLALWVLPCFLLKASCEVVRIRYVHHDSWWQSVGILFALLVSWTYSTVIYLSGSVLFNLVCILQVLHFENYGKLLERDLDVSIYIEEHIRLTHYLSKISHRFRMYLLLQFLIVTASQFVALLQTTGNSGLINVINGADFVVSSIVELVGMIICLHAAAKISHRAQSLASVASRWHALVTCNSNNPSQLGLPNNNENSETVFQGIPSVISSSGSDLESFDYVPFPSNSRLVSYMSLYHKRQALVMYLQSNLGGATIFGWTIDRALINTIFFIELSLVLFVLGKTITFSTY